MLPLAETGCTVHQIMAITETWKQAMHYTQRAAQKQLAQQAQARICDQSGKPWNDKRTKDWLTARYLTTADKRLFVAGSAATIQRLRRKDTHKWRTARWLPETGK
jgi:hypothetical protein